MCKFQLVTPNKNMKKWQTPQDVYNKDADQTVPPHNACLYPARQVLLILTCEFLIIKHLINYTPRKLCL